MEVDVTGKIRINKYDSGEINVLKLYPALEEDDTVVMSVYTFDDEFKDGFIHKTASKSNPIIALTADDTNHQPGRYRYQIKVQSAEGRITTIQPETRFDILR